jgi:hypothetical protein
MKLMENEVNEGTFTLSAEQAHKRAAERMGNFLCSVEKITEERENKNSGEGSASFQSRGK